MVVRRSNSTKSIHTSVLQRQSIFKIHQWSDFHWSAHLVRTIKHTDFVYWKGMMLHCQTEVRGHRVVKNVSIANDPLTWPASSQHSSWWDSMTCPIYSQQVIESCRGRHLSLVDQSLIQRHFRYFRNMSKIPTLVRVIHLSADCQIPPSPPPTSHVTSRLFTESSLAESCNHQMTH